MKIKKLINRLVWLLLCSFLYFSCYKNSFESANEIEKKDYERVKMLISTGDSIYAQRGKYSNFSNALIFYDSANTILKRMDKPIANAVCYYKIGNVYIAWNKEPEKTVFYYKKSLDIFKTLPDFKVPYYNVLYILAHAYDKEKMNDSIHCIQTLEQFKYEIEQEPKQFIDSLYFLPDLSWVAANNGNYKFADEFIKKYVKREKLVNDISSNNYLDHYYITKARIDTYNKRIKNSPYLDSIEYAIIHCNNTMDKYYYLECIAKLYHDVNNKSAEINAFEKQLELDKIIFDNEVTSLKNQNELEKKLYSSTLQKLTLQKTITKTQIGFFIILLILFITLGLWRYRNISQHKSQLEADAIKQNAFTQKLFEVTEQERKRIAIELHDGVSNDLVSLKQSMDNPNELNSRIEEILEGIRLISRNLHPTFFERVGLKYSIQQLIERIQFHDNFMINADINYNGYLNTVQELQLYRIIQEAITNMVKYSSGFAGKITIHETPKEVFVEIKDNGSGFDVKEKLSNINSFGLHNIIERSKAIGGIATITSNSNGTMITITISKN